MATVATLSIAPLVAGLLWAAVEDLRARRIPNWLTFSLVFLGFAQSFGPAGSVTPGDALLGFLVAFGLGLGSYLLGALGGGDVKMLAAVGAWVGPRATIEVMVIVTVVAMVVAIMQMIAQRRTRAVLGSTAVVAVGLIHARELGMTHAAETAKTGHGIDRPLPYAVPVLIALCILMVWR